LIAHADIGSSAGRGTRAANWFADYLEDQKDESIESLVLQGGIKGWVGAGEEYREEVSLNMIERWVYMYINDSDTLGYLGL
jgi:hypothetical protein